MTQEQSVLDELLARTAEYNSRYHDEDDDNHEETVLDNEEFETKHGGQTQ